MNQIELLRNQIATRIPNATFNLDRPAKPPSNWWLDIELDGHTASVEWRPGKGFGISASASAGYGEGPHETYVGVGSAADRLIEILLRAEHTEPPKETILKRLRESRRISQQELAQSLNVKQATISKMERRSDMYISTIRKIIAAMGGELEIRARFPGVDVKIVQFEDPALEPSESARD